MRDPSRGAALGSIRGNSILIKIPARTSSPPSSGARDNGLRSSVHSGGTIQRPLIYVVHVPYPVLKKSSRGYFFTKREY